MGADAWIDSINSLNAIYTPEPPLNGILYHYTDFAGLQGILESHNLRATYNRVLNDASEQAHAERVLHEELTRLLISSPERQTISSDERKRFVTCFCESAKLLSMWRAYAGSGGGYCLGFDYSHLRHMWWPEPKVGQSIPLLARVHYGNTPESIRSYLSAICKSESRINDLWLKLPPFFPSMIKHEAFAEECEWRTIALDPPIEHMKFKSGNANVRPYVELSWRGKLGGRLPLVSVTFGPTLRREDRPEEIIGWMLEKNSYTDVTVTSSDIPFRL
jgi:hypothetical protein